MNWGHLLGMSTQGSVRWSGCTGIQEAPLAQSTLFPNIPSHLALHVGDVSKGPTSLKALPCVELAGSNGWGLRTHVAKKVPQDNFSKPAQRSQSFQG